VKRGVAGMETAFRAEFAFGKGDPPSRSCARWTRSRGWGTRAGTTSWGGVACAAAALAEFGKGAFRAGR